MMTNRIPLTKKLTQELLRSRKDLGFSQYELANKLGWVRSKIKRIEKAEVSTVDEGDLKALDDVLGTTSVQGAAPKKRISKVPFSKVPFSKAVRKRKNSRYKNQAFFTVTLREDRVPEELIGLEFECDGIRGPIHGVESTQTQKLIRAGERILVMLWKEGVGLKS